MRATTNIRHLLAGIPVALAIAATATLTFAAPPASAREIIIAPVAPPPPRVEVIPAPRAGRVWESGHWHWVGQRYAWVPGGWRPVVVGSRFVPGGWRHHGRRWAWSEGRWER